MKNEFEIKKFLAVISQPVRLKIIKGLKKSCCAGQVWQCLNLPQNLISHHLKVLKNAKLVKSTRQGKMIIYCLDKKVLSKKLKILNKYLNNDKF
jgi:ArsR family transcriptional regulator